MSLEKRFFQGDYRSVLASSVDAQMPRVSNRDLGWIIGALSFLGRLDEASVLYRTRQNAMGARERIQARFFLGVALSRQSRYEESRHFFGLNFRESAKKLAPESRFFVYQGLAFNRYFSGRFMAASRASEKSFTGAMEGDFLFGKVLAADIRGHILVHNGEVAKGLKLLKQAQEWAGLLGNQAVTDAIQISLLIYGAQFGLQPKKILSQLSKALKRLSPQDTYSKPNLLLELSRQHMLRGKLEDAYKCLDAAAEIIYSTQNRRQEVVLNHRYAYLHYLEGEPARALHFTRSARKSLNLSVDRALEVEVLGLETKIYSELKRTDLCENGKARLEKLSRIYGGSISKQVLMRDQQGEHDIRKGADPLGEIVNRIRSSKRSHDAAVDEVLETEYFSFLYDLLSIPRDRRCVYLELVPGSVTLFDRGRVMHSQGLTALLKSVAVQAARGEGSKKKLIEEIWGNTYHPLRHDAVVYSAATSLRKLLGDRAEWLETTEEGYRFRPGIQIQFHQALVEKAPQGLPTIKKPAVDLSLRQLKVLKYLSENESLDARTLKKLFRVSEITATRDLARLTVLELVVRVGKGRATRYLLPEKAAALA